MKIKNKSKCEVVISTLEGKGYLIEGGKSIEISGTVHPHYFKQGVVEVVEDKTKKIKEGEE